MTQSQLPSPLTKMTDMIRGARNDDHRVVARGIVIVFVVLGLLYSVVVPSWEAPDEADHFAYVRYIRTEHALPMQVVGVGNVGTAHHPPLFYLLAALVSLPVDIHSEIGQYRLNPKFLFAFRGGYELNRHILTTGDTFPYAGLALALRLMRWLSLLFGAGTVWLTYRLVLDWLPNRPSIACFAMALVAFNPQFIFISAAAMNDAMVACMATGVLWSLGRAVKRPPDWRPWFAVGVWTGLAAMSKISGLALAPVAAVTLLWVAWRRRSSAVFWRGGLALAVPVAVLTGWWFIRNLSLYGELLGSEAWLRQFAGAVRTQPVDWPSVSMQVLRSAWAVFGWLTVAAPTWYFSVIWLLLGISGIGLLHFGLSQWRRQTSEIANEIRAVVASVLLVGYQLLLIGREILQWVTGNQGRYLFPAIAPAMLLVSAGWVVLLPQLVRRVVLAGVAAGLLALAIFLPLAVIGPNFHLHKTEPRRSLWLARHPVHIDFGGEIGLRAYDYQLDPQRRDRLHLTLYWSALRKPQLNYSSFAHVLLATADVSAMLGQQDQVPGTQIDYTPANWLPDDLIRDERDIDLAIPLKADDYQIRVGVYNYESGGRLQLQPPQDPPDYVLLPMRITD